MKILSIALSGALLSLAALAYRASPLDDATPPSEAIPCDGCGFINAPSPANHDATPNPCGTQLKLTVFGLSGACEREAEGAECLPASNCWALMVVDYTSACDVQLDTYPFGAHAATIAGPPSDTWRTIASNFSIMTCGGPGKLGYVRLRDSGGHTISNSYKYYCAACEL